ncbi:MAG: type II toxin-antitoxin system RelE/ParE family toxin [Candidatus Latescibacteria bacterium]|nr:type II toxin-antitoxin system RelE/ParE family toxin [Candidatus Latescibacterota bacterium]
MVFSDRAQSDVRRLDRATAQRVIGKLRWLAENFEATKLTALTGPEQGQFRLRVGDYRVVYAFDRNKQEIEVYRVRHRREVYRD